MCNLESDMPRLINVENPVARKQHICCECSSIINKGEKYEKTKGLWDDFATFKTCSFCATVRIHAHSEFDLNYDEGFAFGELWECIGMDFVV